MSVGRALAVYSTLRLALFGASAAVFWLLGLHVFAALLLAVVMTALLSVVLLQRQRDGLALALAERREARQALRDRLSTTALDDPDDDG